MGTSCSPGPPVIPPESLILLFPTFFYLFVKKSSIEMCCSMKSLVLLCMYKGESASLLDRQSPFVLTVSHMLGQTAAP